MTQTDREIKTIKNRSFLLQNRIAHIEAAKDEIEYEIDKLDKWKRYFESGYYLYAQEGYPEVVLPGGITYTITNVIRDDRNVGKDRLILERKDEIKKMDSTINIILNQKKNNQKIIDSLRNKPDKTILEISSVVMVKGMEASGTKKIQYKVVQYRNGEIKTVQRIK